MLSDEIAAAGLALGLALQQGDDRTLRLIAGGVHKRLQQLEADAVEWQGAAAVAPLARLPDGAAAANVVQFRRRAE